MIDLAVVYAMIMLHGPDGREIYINSEEITAVHCKLPGVPNALFTDGVNALVNLTDGKHVGVTETCGEIRDMIEGRKL